MLNHNVMRKLLLLAALACLTACQPSADEQAEPLMQRIDSLYQHNDYQGTLNAIRELRAEHPKATECRKRALKIWQEASVKMAHADIARTDSALQATGRQLGAARSIYERNMLSLRRDSLQSRYDVLCAQVRYILMKQKEYQSQQQKNEKATPRH